jgi:catalase (peroxidase I)
MMLTSDLALKADPPIAPSPTFHQNPDLLAKAFAAPGSS